MYCGIVGRFVGDSDDDSIVFLGINNRPRIHFVDCNDILGVAQLCNFLGLHLYINHSSGTEICIFKSTL